MGTLTAIAPILGLLAGVIIANYAKSELKDGKKYFIILQHLLLAVIVGILVERFGLTTAIITGVIVFLISFKLFKHKLVVIPLMAIIATFDQRTQIPIFLYFIPAGTLHYKENKKLLIYGAFYILLAIVTTLRF